jgi:hypothetical protein
VLMRTAAGPWDHRAVRVERRPVHHLIALAAGPGEVAATESCTKSRCETRGAVPVRP